MLRTDREIEDRGEIIDVLSRCDTVRIGLTTDGCAYVVPVSFGLKVKDGIICVYFHGARMGYKTEILKKNARVCVEGDVFLGVEKTERGITTRYESVIGFGRAEQVFDEEIVEGLRAINGHYGFTDYPVERCKGLERTAVYKITIERITGKRNKG